MAQKKGRTTKVKARPARRRQAKKPARAGKGKVQRKAAGAAAAGTERKLIEELRAENRRLREELDQLRSELRPAVPAVGGVPTLPLGEPLPAGD